MTISWTSWGPSQPTLPQDALAFLRAELGPLHPSRPVAVGDARLAASSLAPDVLDRFRQALGDAGVRTDDETRARHCGGQSYVDVVTRRAGDASGAPDAVLLPGDAAQVADVLRIGTDARVAVVPWGGGTSVVGGVAAVRGGCGAVVVLDLSRLDRLVHVDATSLLASFQPGIRTPAAEAALAAHGLTLGHVPQSFERASLGGYVVTRSAGQASTGYGRIDDLVAGLRLATPVGELVLPAHPASAAGPDLRRLVLGSEGTLGVVTEVTLRVRRRPRTRRYDGWMLPSWDAGTTALRRLAQDGPHPEVARLSDPQETRISLALGGSGRLTRRALATYLRARRVSRGCLVITGFEGGGAADVSYRRTAVRDVLRDCGAVALGSRAGRSWEHGRFAAPYLRDALLDEGVLVETLETAATWTALARVYDGVHAALRHSLGDALVGCHVSHLYPTGASLYFTVLAGAGDDGPARWTRAKHAANDAIVATGGTITHHHAVGTVHRDHVVHDLGEIGVAALRAVKQRLDPAGILNPGKLLPDPVPLRDTGDASPSPGTTPREPSPSPQQQ